jgi:hypothetical protein
MADFMKSQNHQGGARSVIYGLFATVLGGCVMLAERDLWAYYIVKC